MAGFAVIEADGTGERAGYPSVTCVRCAILFTDIHMPGPMDGLALAHHTHKSWPWVALLITSGEAFPTSLPCLPEAGFCPRHYTPSYVLAHVRELAATA